MNCVVIGTRENKEGSCRCSEAGSVGTQEGIAAEKEDDRDAAADH